MNTSEEFFFNSNLNFLSTVLNLKNEKKYCKVTLFCLRVFRSKKKESL